MSSSLVDVLQFRTKINVSDLERCRVYNLWVQIPTSAKLKTSMKQNISSSSFGRNRGLPSFFLVNSGILYYVNFIGHSLYSCGECAASGTLQFINQLHLTSTTEYFA